MKRIEQARKAWDAFVQRQRDYQYLWSLMREPVAWQEFRLIIAAHCVQQVAEERKLTVIEVLSIVDRYITIATRKAQP